ncbi:hypothetical protein GCM10009127_20550 [Alteraurantiacibacter aestuarii]|uniref:TadE/TadG family type IV pilus assembly protein n=1 Tax=Alteraurantiacibacter aestuarii TaxID=650004 RepID=UPI0031E46933
MIALRKLLFRLLGHERGSIAIETAFVVPVLLLLTLGGFEVSRLVARQTELQGAAAEAAAVVRAKIPETAADRETLRDIIKASTGLSSWQVWVYPVYRCGTASDYVLANTDCSGTGTVTEYVRVLMFDTYTPVWTSFGISEPVYFSVRRSIQVG